MATKLCILYYKNNFFFLIGLLLSPRRTRFWILSRIEESGSSDSNATGSRAEGTEQPVDVTFCKRDITVWSLFVTSPALIRMRRSSLTPSRDVLAVVVDSLFLRGSPYTYAAAEAPAPRISPVAALRAERVSTRVDSFMARESRFRYYRSRDT